MVGGDEDAYRRVEAILRELGTPTYIGENGQGLVLKLTAINISLAVQMLAFAEGLLLAERSGVDPPAGAGRDGVEPDRLADAQGARGSIILDPAGRSAWFDPESFHAQGHRVGARRGRAGSVAPAADHRARRTRCSSAHRPSATADGTSRHCFRPSGRWHRSSPDSTGGLELALYRIAASSSGATVGRSPSEEYGVALVAVRQAARPGRQRQGSRG